MKASEKKSKQLKVAISGKSGCGNSTVSKIVASKLGFRMINYTFRSIAEEKGISFNELLKMAQQDDYWDRYLDKKQVEMTEGGNCVLGSRLAVWVLKDADFTVYLTASTEVRAKRIHQREGGELSDVLKATEQRDQNDHARYLELYDIDNDAYDFVDFVVDTEKYNTPDQVAELIIDKIRASIKTET